MILFLGNENDIAVGGDEMTDFHHVVDAFRAALSFGPCVIIIDGVDELGETYGHSPQQVYIQTIRNKKNTC